MVRLTLRKHLFGTVYIIGSIELIALGLFVYFTFPRSIPFDIAKTAFEKIIDVDTALLGFTGVIVAVSIQTWKKQYKYSLAVLAVVVAFLLVSLVSSVGELVVGTPVGPEAFVFPLAYLILGITLLFYGLARIGLPK
ncbi:MAG: hypothetical protein ABSE39_02805 [Candidatus Bathyarchaeia archaeon]|jgi:hypothetical protein